MKFYKKIFVSLYLLLLASSHLISQEKFSIENQPTALVEALGLPNHGILKKNAKGMVYLDISNKFISLSNLIDLPGQIISASINPGAIGAHIPVFLESEHFVPDELGKTFYFDVLDIRSSLVKTKNGLIKPWEITINSPDLEKIRKKYNFSLLKDNFCIRIGRQLPTAPEGSEKIVTLSHYNFSNVPTLPIAAKGDFISVHSDEILATALKVDSVGQLCIKNNGFAYVNVNNEFIESIAPLLPIEGNFNPLVTSAKAMGAHISVFYEDEMIGHKIWLLEEAGEWFKFEVKEIRYLERKTSNGKTRLWLIAVDAPALQRLRTHYGLKPKLQGHDFHITIGTEKFEIESSTIFPEVDAA
ncbi:MAG: hypothetical protein H0W50_08440 [Parachlamydiaceae bacterium]|nr:hypothetical protein [Parachlamydiaceae bacterium]